MLFCFRIYKCCTPTCWLSSLKRSIDKKLLPYMDERQLVYHLLPIVVYDTSGSQPYDMSFK